MPSNNLEVDINVNLSKGDDLEEEDSFESDTDSCFGDEVVEEINSQIYKFFKLRTVISKNSSIYWQDIPAEADLKQRISTNVLCRSCGKVMLRKLALDHILSHLKGFYPFHCILCGSGCKVKFKSWKPFENHFIKRHYDFYKEHSSICSKCNKIAFIQKHFCGPVKKPVPRKKPKIFKSSPILNYEEKPTRDLDLKKEVLCAWNFEVETSFLISTDAAMNNAIQEVDADLSHSSDELILSFEQF